MLVVSTGSFFFFYMDYMVYDNATQGGVAVQYKEKQHKYRPSIKRDDLQSTLYSGTE